MNNGQKASNVEPQSFNNKYVIIIHVIYELNIEVIWSKTIKDHEIN